MAAYIFGMILAFSAVTLGLSVAVTWWAVSRLDNDIKGVVAQVNDRLTQFNAHLDAQRRTNVWLADKVGDALLATRQGAGSGKVVPLRQTPPDGKL